MISNIKCETHDKYLTYHLQSFIANVSRLIELLGLLRG